MNNRWTVRVDASPEKVWPLVAKLKRHADWSPKPYTVEWLSGEPNAVGSKFRSVGWLPNDKNHAMEGEVIESDAPKRFAVRTSDSQGSFVNTLTLEPSGAGTTVTRQMDFPPASGFGKLAFSIIFPLVVRPGVQKGMDLLRQKAEGAG